ncbi:DUF1002 domain-containing protein [Salsuginibacillus kocurii]|uniref:DUF1002 domain-containing protein n=1 Tax=Salsuginibacillus kocurii TaxID=427078 RepID=UPI0003798A6F|nr:DUF1002 domain-containing protein [Salsuginibacillus kocurii]
MKLRKSWFVTLSFAMVFSLGLTQPAQGVAEPGDVIYTLGEDLDSTQRSNLLNEMGGDEESHIVEVSNEEEHEALGAYVSAEQIGSNAISSSRITIEEEGEGINVETHNINWVSEGMYANALITAGVQDAEVYVTAPFEVSGTGALTGLLKAYEAEADMEITEEQKQVANEEMVRTAELADEVGEEDATELITRIKEHLDDESIETEEDLRDLIDQIAAELGIELSEENREQLVSLFDRMKDLDIDWNQVQNQLNQLRDNFDDWVDSGEAENFFSNLMDFLNELIDTVQGWFTTEQS